MKSSAQNTMQKWVTMKKISFNHRDLKEDLFAKIKLAAPNRKLYQSNEAVMLCFDHLLRIVS